MSTRMMDAPSRTSATSIQKVIAVLLPILLVLPSSVEADGCTLACQQDAPCVEGAFNFTAHPSLDGSDTDLSSGSSTRTSQHCACPHKFTGLLCDIPYESCDAEHPCYNHGKCVPGILDDYGNEQLFCNCDDAIVDGVQYVGKYCEQKADAKDYCDAGKTVFCVNGGKCNPSYPAQGQTPCKCPSGFTGPSCQYSSGSVPTCDLPCANGGVCSFDVDTDAGLYQYWEPENTAVEDSDSTHMQCKCPDDFTGRLCQVPQVKCGSESYCYNGGTCVEHQVDGKTQYDCDCSSATSDSSTNFAGSMCQFAATSYCTSDSQGVNGRLFCVNNGKCKSNPVEGCECQDPYTGFSCEFILQELDKNNMTSSATLWADDFVRDDDAGFGSSNASDPGEAESLMDDEAPRIYGDIIYDSPDNTKCDLQCVNGGTCRVGVKEMGNLLDDLAVNAPSVNQSIGTHDNFQHCVCPDGYYGLYCEESLDICGPNEHMCLHGGKCIQNDQDESLCDCNTNNDNSIDVVSSVYYAGDSCEHPVDDICTDSSYADKESAPLSFCVNGGTCKKHVGAEEAHPGCYCPPEFTGPHCELRQSSSSRNNDNHGSSSSASPSMPAFQIVLIVIGMIVIVTISVLAGTACVRRYRMRKDIANSLRWKDGLYRDEPGSGGGLKNQVNIAPRRASYFDDVSYPIDKLPSGTDPMATHLAPKTPILPNSSINGNSSSALDSAAGTTADNDEDETPAPQSEVFLVMPPPMDEDGHVLHSVEIC